MLWGWVIPGRGAPFPNPARLSPGVVGREAPFVAPNPSGFEPSFPIAGSTERGAAVRRNAASGPAGVSCKAANNPSLSARHTKGAARPFLHRRYRCRVCLRKIRTAFCSRNRARSRWPFRNSHQGCASLSALSKPTFAPGFNVFKQMRLPVSW